jgi:HlyD family secretion protein
MRACTRRLLFLAVAAGLTILIVLALRPAAVPAEVVSADSGPVRVTVDWTGKTRVRDRYDVAAPVTGQLERIALRAGDRVKAGDVVARIAGAWAPPLDPRSRAEASARLESAVAAQAEARAALQRAAAASTQARRDAERTEELRRAGAASAQALDAARADADVREEERRMAEAAVVRTAADVAAARAALATAGKAGAALIDVQAPVAGSVLRVLHESAGPVQAGAPLLEIGDPSRLEVVLDLPTADAVRIRAGQQATVAGWGGGMPLRAVVERVEPSGYTKISPLGVEEQRVDVILDTEGQGWEALGDGYSVDARIVVEELPAVVRVPVGSIFRDQAGWALYALEDGRARRRAVEVAARGDREAAIRLGVRPGDRVLVHPADEVKDGVRISER